MNVDDDDSSGSEYVPAADEEEEEDEVKDTKKRKQEEEVALLADAELDAMWSEMNTKPKETAKSTANKLGTTNNHTNAAGGGVGGSTNVAASNANQGAKPQSTTAGGINIADLLAEVESEKPKLETETVRFAGQDVQVQKKQKKKEGDNVKNIIAELRGSKVKKISTLEKTDIDWEAHKADNQHLEDELNRHMKSNTYLEKVSFLKRAEYKQYEMERDAKK